MQIDCLDVRCPNCSGTVYLFGQSYVVDDETEWSDGFHDYEGLSCGLLSCPLCAAAFRQADAAVLRLHDFDDQSVQTANELTLAALPSAIASGVASSFEEEKRLRLYFWRAGNHAQRYAGSGAALEPWSCTAEQQANLHALTAMLDRTNSAECLLLVEIARQQGCFALAQELLNAPCLHDNAVRPHMQALVNARATRLAILPAAPT